MCHVQRDVLGNEARASYGFGIWCVTPMLIVGIHGGCETAAPWVDQPASGHLQVPAEVSREYAPAPPQENRRTAVVCDATGSSNSSFVGTSETPNPDNGTTPVCVTPPCAIDRDSDAKQQTATVYFDLRSYYDATDLNEAMISLTGIPKGGATVQTTKTFGPLTLIRVDHIDYNVAITVDASDFLDISSATLSWISNAKSLGNPSQDLWGCVCCEEYCAVVNGTPQCTCTRWGTNTRPCP